MAVIRNMMVRVVGDFSGLVSQTKTGAQATTSWATKTNQAFKSVAAGSAGLKTAATHVTTFQTALNALGIFSLKYYAIMKGIEFLKNGVTAASDLVEVQNVVDTAFGNLAYKAEEFAKTSNASYGLTGLQAKKYSSNYMAMAKSMGLTGEAAADMSVNLTALAGDAASFFNTDQEEAYEKLRSIFTGTIKPLRDFGVSMTQADLENYALSKGLDVTINTMTQAEKAALRYSYVMDALSYVQGDFTKTSKTWANQVRQLTNNLSQLGAIIGRGLIAVFRPLLIVVNQALQGLIWFGNTVTEMFEAVFGKAESYASGGFDMSDLTSDMDDLTATTTAATGAASALKRQLMGFDEINKLSDPSVGGIGAVSGSINDLLGQMGNASVDVVEDTAGRLKETCYGYLEMVDSAAKTVEATGGHLETAGYSVARAWTAQAAGMSDLSGQFETFFGAIGDGINGLLDSNQGAAIACGNAWNAQAQSSQQAWGWITGLIDSNQQAAIDCGNAWNAQAQSSQQARGWITGAWDGFKSWLAEGASLSSTLRDSIGGAFEDFFTWLKSKLANTSLGKMLGITVDETGSGVTGKGTITAEVKLERTGTQLFNDFKYGWNATGKTVGVTAGLSNTAAGLANQFEEAWAKASPTVTVNNRLSASGSALSSSVVKDFGTPLVYITPAVTKKLTVKDFMDTAKKIQLNWTPQDGANGLSEALSMGSVSFAARGGIVDRATLFGSVVAGEAGREAIIPLENHTEWMDGVAERIAARMAGTLPQSGGEYNINVTVDLDGRVVGQTTVKYIQDEARAGHDPLGAYI